MSDETKEIVKVDDQALVPADPTSLDKNHVFFTLLPKPSTEALTQDEQQKAATLQNAFNILGPAAGAALVCPGNQFHVAEDVMCPYSAKCVMLKAQKAPEGELCPIEAQEIENRFLGWCKELSKNPLSLTESERAFVSEMVWIAVQEYRCSSIVAKGRDARLTQLNPKEVHPETLDPIAWDRVIHANIERLDQLSASRRMLMKEWMLNPEQKWKKQRAEGLNRGTDISSRQSALADKLRRLQSGKQAPPIIDVEVEPDNK